MDSGLLRVKVGVCRVLIAMIVGVACCGHVIGQQLQQARVTQVVNDVKLLPSQAASRPAVVNDEIKQGTAVRTGTNSRTELTFTDLTITRLGANTIFSFRPGTRDLKINSGALLIQIPPGAPEVKVSTAAVSAAISGGTAIFDAATGKFMILEGIGRMWPVRHPELATIVHAGEIVWLTRTGQIRRPETFNVKRVTLTSRLINRFPPLPNIDLIEQVIQQQEGGNSSQPVSKSDMDIISQRFAIVTPTPNPTQTEFGSPQTILSPNPYAINSGTTITTDPLITTDGSSDRGTIYRGSSIDGPYSTWAFGSTSAFDNSSGFDAQFNGRGAAFKFTALQLTGDPSIDTTNGETSLGLIGVNGITSAGPGGILTFSGIQELLLATQNGPITLGPEISFNVQGLTLYARGPGSDLTLDSDISSSRNLHLYGQHDIAVTSAIEAPTIELIAGNNITFDRLNTSQTINTSDGHVLLQAGNNIAATDQISVNRKAAPGSSNLDVTFDAGADLTVGSGFLGNGLSITIDNSGGNIFPSGAAISTTVGGNITINGSPGFAALIDNSGGSSLGGNAVIGVSAASITTGSDFSNTIKNQMGGVINGNAAIAANVAGDINSGGNAFFQITNFGNQVGSLGGQIGGTASIDINAADFSANSLLAEINSGNGGVIGSTASININIPGTVTTAADATIQVVLTPGAPTTLNAIDINGGTYEVGGTFLTKIAGGDGTITLNNAAIHANVVKVGCLGINGVLNIGSGTISADTLLKLYAGGSNGTINFNSSVTLNGNSSKIIAANTINIFNGVVLTINGPVPADIYTNNPNYAVASGGNGTHSGTINGTAGANNPQSLSNAPGFDAAAINSSAVSRTKIATANRKRSHTGRRATAGNGRRGLKPPRETGRNSNNRRRGMIKVADTNQLRDLIDNATPGAFRTTRKGVGRSNLQSSRDTSHRVNERASPDSVRQPSRRSPEPANRFSAR